MKYLYLLIGIIFIGCNSKSITVEAPKTTTKIEEVAKKQKPVVEEEPIIVEEQVVAEEPKITKKIKPDIPKKCAMWSDGCNVCTRIDSKKASCTTYPECHNRLVSCLQWN
jgi:tetrahydromethanopterin S-methyltransferase subunit A